MRRRMNTLSGNGCSVDHEMLRDVLHITAERGREDIRVAYGQAVDNAVDGVHVRWERIEQLVQYVCDVASLLHVVQHMNTDKKTEGFQWKNLTT